MVMDIIIAGALPHTSIAGEAVNHLSKAAPNLLQRLQTHHAQTQPIDVEATGCTPLEYYQLQAAGLAPQASSLAAYCLPADLQQHVHAGQALYLLRLGHIALGQTSASMHTADELTITPAQSLALFENVQTIFEHSPYKLLAYHPEYFLVDLGAEFADTEPALLPSPGLLATGYLNDWWPQDERTRPLRALLGELQMSWFNHPVNREREAKGQRAINTAWIFGGIKATPEVLARVPQASKNTTQKYRLINSLLHAHRQQDWGMWIQQLSVLDKELPAILNGEPSPLTGQARTSGQAHTSAAQNQASGAQTTTSAAQASGSQQAIPASRIILCGLDRLVILTPQNKFKQLLQSKNQWKTWW